MSFFETRSLLGGRQDMTDENPSQLALVELYLATAEKISDRRAQANSWMLSVNSAIVAFHGFVQADKAVGTAASQSVWLWAMPVAGAIVCLSWAALLSSYRELNSAKFQVLLELEKSMPVMPFARERAIYHGMHRTSFSTIERIIPLCFFLLYVAMLGTTLSIRIG
jgi:hypothetical protein